MPRVIFSGVLLYFLVVIRTNGYNLKYHDPAKVSYSIEETDVERFTGNDSMNYFLRLLLLENDTALVGGRNVLYNISLDDLTELSNQRIEWTPLVAHVELCKLKGKSDDDCQNYIRVAAKTNNSKALLVCGTHAYKPLCQEYDINQGVPKITRSNLNGVGMCPFDATHNSSIIYTDGHLYSATVADFSHNDPLIFREPLRTEKSDMTQLNDPNFVGSIAYNDYVLFFFREPAVEYINCGKIIYSRVGRVCKNDKGGSYMFHNKFTTFLKSRLNCSLPGEYPFYFDEIQDISAVVHGEYAGISEQLIYGVFNTPVNAIGASAICAFSLGDIFDAFNGYFKEQENFNANWLRVPAHRVPNPRPANCYNDSRTLTDSVINFAKTHPLMDQAVPAFHKHPVYVRVSLQYRLSAIAVDAKVKTIDGEKIDILFLGTDDGKVLKVSSIVGQSKSDVSTNVIEELQIIENAPIRKLSVIKPSNSEAKLLIVSDRNVHSIPLHRCGRQKSCIECVGLQDPYCSWDTLNLKCVYSQDLDVKKSKQFIQNVTHGQHKHCIQTDNDIPAQDLSNSIDNNIDLDNEITKCPVCTDCSSMVNACNKEQSDKIAVVYVTDTMGLIMVFLVLLTLAFGFALGYAFSRRFRPDSYSNVSLRPNHQLNRLADNSVNMEGGSSFLPSCPNNKAATINLVLNDTKNPNDKNATLDSKTLQRVKKTYI
ncbi:semaphorin-1A-like isoform X2 [Planococcus citri]|uniref:semaphorin-1A-like isoform X2 n=1 Tax=Planococcus citri TaxID=170843 RepID=UPI0031F8CC6E